MSIYQDLLDTNEQYRHIESDDKIEADMNAQAATLEKFAEWHNEGEAIYCDENGFNASGWIFEADIKGDDDNKVIEAQNKLEHINNFYVGAYEDELEKIERQLAEKMIEACDVYVFDDPQNQLNDVAAQFPLSDNGGDPDGPSWITDDIGDGNTDVEMQAGWRVKDYARDKASRDVDGNWCGFSSRRECFALDKDTAIALAIESIKVAASHE